MNELSLSSTTNPFLKLILKKIIISIYKKNHQDSKELIASKKVETINISTPDITLDVQQLPIEQIQELKKPQPPKKILAKISPISGTPSPSQHYNLEKLNLLINDLHVYSIECPGPGKPLKTKSFGFSSQTKIILTEKEIRAVIERFSSEAKIPNKRNF